MSTPCGGGICGRVRHSTSLSRAHANSRNAKRGLSNKSIRGGTEEPTSGRPRPLWPHSRPLSAIALMFSGTGQENEDGPLARAPDFPKIMCPEVPRWVLSRHFWVVNCTRAVGWGGELTGGWGWGAGCSQEPFLEVSSLRRKRSKSSRH